jgi:hypothetical protein
MPSLWERFNDVPGGNGLSYYLGPAARPISQLAQFLPQMSPGADMVDMHQQSADLMRSRTPGDAGRAGLGLLAATMGMAIPGTAKGISEGVEALARKPYRANYRNDVEAHYNPQFFDVEEDALADEAGNVLASKDILRAKPGLADRVPAQAADGVMFRGMSAAEYEDMTKTGRIQSKGAYNIGPGQDGLTYYSTDPSAAESYANSFAPQEHMPTFDRPAYVVAVKRPGDDRLRRVRGTWEHELGVTGAIPAGDVLGVYRGDVVDYNGGIDTPGFKQKPRARLHWSQIKGGGV